MCYNRRGRKSEVQKEINHEIYNHYFLILTVPLLNTLADLAAATNHALAEHKPSAPRTVRLFVGNGIRKLIERAVPADTPAELQEEVFASFNRYYKQHCADSTALGRRRAAAFCSSALQAAVQPLFPTKRITAQALAKQYFDGRLDAAWWRARAGIAKACAGYAAGNRQQLNAEPAAPPAMR